ncbi:hypothetical protein SCOCK_90032 [Actinacidiphila cocklensis]|uniref:Uncharacterized protein n=1 Tax=Actinacidiphila cocklensis TaxID=887465 RepID=A0A9W4E516_9ACTN|nr:hypothetical protein SCOCK_90032 [Actinacidiphila cocklensis]
MTAAACDLPCEPRPAPLPAVRAPRLTAPIRRTRRPAGRPGGGGRGNGEIVCPRQDSNLRHRL